MRITNPPSYLFLFIAVLLQVFQAWGGAPKEYKEPTSKMVRFVLNAFGDARSYSWVERPVLNFEIQDPLLAVEVKMIFEKAFNTAFPELEVNKHPVPYNLTIYAGDEKFLKKNEELKEYKIHEGYRFHPNRRTRKAVTYILTWKTDQKENGHG